MFYLINWTFSNILCFYGNQTTATRAGYVRVHFSHNKSNKLNDPEIADDEENFVRSAYFDYEMPAPNGYVWTYFCMNIYQAIYDSLIADDYLDRINPDMLLKAIELRGGDTWFKVDSFKERLLFCLKSYRIFVLKPMQIMFYR